MKYISFLTILIFFIIFSSNSAEALTATPTTQTSDQPIQEKLENQIDELKEKIASRVSELNLVEKRGIIGVIDDVSGNKITVTDVHDIKRLIDVDEITKFSSAASKGFGLSDLKKGMRVSILGLYNKQSERILARFIQTSVNPQIISGTINKIDDANYQFTILSEDQSETVVDVSTTTKLNTYSKETDLTKSGFSKLTVGDRIVVVGYPSKTDPKLIVASRGIIFPDLPQNPKIVVAQPADETTPTDDITPLPTKAPTKKSTTQTQP